MLLIGLDVSARLPAVAGGGKACPLALGVKPEPCARTTWLLTMSTGMSRIEVSLAPPPLGPADGDVEQLLPLDHGRHGLGGRWRC